MLYAVLLIAKKTISEKPQGAEYLTNWHVFDLVMYAEIEKTFINLILAMQKRAAKHYPAANTTPLSSRN
jgi:hypothetical protein